MLVFILLFNQHLQPSTNELQNSAVYTDLKDTEHKVNLTVTDTAEERCQSHISHLGESGGHYAGSPVLGLRYMLRLSNYAGTR